MSKIKVGSGLLLQVTKPGFAANRMLKEGERKTLIEVGDIIEITIAYAWHFRTLDGDYFVADEDYILEHCTPFAWRMDVFELRGKMTLEEIMRYQFYKGLDRANGYQVMPDYEAYKAIKLAAFDKSKERDRKFLERQVA